jgi:hypothetical protein
VGRQLYSRQPTLHRRRKRFFAKKSDFDEKTDDSQTFRSLQAGELEANTVAITIKSLAEHTFDTTSFKATRNKVTRNNV